MTNILQIQDRLERFERCKRHLANARSGHVFSGHIPYDPELAKWLDNQGVRRIFVYRDPRDYAVSHSHFIMNLRQKLPLYPTFSHLEDDHSRLMACINGIGEGRTSARFSATSLPNVKLFYGQFLGWLDDPNTFSVRYEDFITDQPGHLNPEAPQKLRSLVSYLQVLKEEQPLDDDSLSAFLQSTMDPNKSPTFRLGKKGTWKDEFSPEHVQVFKEIAGDLLIKLAYERDLNWGPIPANIR
jgi:hypothetical protein